MVNTTRASLMAQIGELRYFAIITGYQEMEMVDKVNAWAKKQEEVKCDEFVGANSFSEVNGKVLMK